MEKRQGSGGKGNGTRHEAKVNRDKGQRGESTRGGGIHGEETTENQKVAGDKRDMT